MRISDYGPVPVSKLKDESRAMFAALAKGRRVLISRRGSVIAAIRPPTEGDAPLLAVFALPADDATPLTQLTATTINQSASSTINSVFESDSLAFVTNSQSVLGFLERYEADTDKLTPEDHATINTRIAAFLEETPDASAQAVADFQAKCETDILEAIGKNTPVRLDRTLSLIHI